MVKKRKLQMTFKFPVWVTRRMILIETNGSRGWVDSLEEWECLI